MKLHRLHFGNIGPFTHVDPIDFGALSRNGLFLIQGPTGAGKSTVIDAIVFALYGSVAGAGSDAQRLVSTFADLRTETPFADLAFEVHGGLYRVRREPRFERPKLRGEGTTSVPPKAYLYRLAGEHQLHASIDELDGPIASGVVEVGGAIKGLLGLDHGQFTQTMVLPQGEFTTFLKAKAKDRRDLLQDLFDTGIYSTIEATLLARRREAERGFADSLAEVERGVAAFGQAARLEGEQRDGLLAIADDHGALREAISAQLAVVNDQHRSAVVAHGLANEAFVAAELDHHQREEAVQRINARQQLDRRIAALAADADQARERDQQLALFAAAAVSLQAHDEWVERVGILDAAQAQRDLLVPQFPHLREASEQQVTDLAAACVAELQSLAPELEAENQLASREQAFGVRKRELAATDSRLRAIETETAERTSLQAALAGEYENTAAAEQQLASASDALEQLARRRAALTSLALHEGQRDRLRADAARVSTRLEEVSREFQALSSQYRLHTAAFLASTLQPASPCLVCGSIDHPHPAVLPADATVTREQVDAAADSETQLRAQVAASVQLVHDAELECARLEAIVGPNHDALEEEIQEVEKRRAEAKSATERRSEIKTQISREQTALDSLGVEWQTLHDLSVTLGTELAAERSALDATVARLARARGDFSSVAARLDSLEAQRSAFVAFAAAVRSVEQATGRVHECRRALDQALAGAGIGSDDDLQQIRALAPQVEALELARQQRLQEQAQVAALRTEFADVDVTRVVDTQESAAALNLAQVQRDDALAAMTAAARVAEDSAARATEIEAVTAHLERERAGAATLLSLSSLVSGDRGSTLSLSLYAVRRRFREVIDIANHRLAGMLGGRLTLVARDDPSDGRESVGLALSVRDDVSGQERDTATVSGGEGFCCALALALGLAEVVSAEQGQRRAESLFVDEGFGSLDAETLAEVTAVLESLRGEGRMVAVVSHVAAMQEQINQKLDVRRIPGRPSEFSVILP